MNHQPDISNNHSNSISASLSPASPVERMPAHAVDNASFYAPDSDSEVFSWQRILTLIRRRRRIIAAVFTVVVAVSLLKLYFAPHIYAASADLLINSKSSGNSSDLAAISSLQEATSTRAQDTEVEILRSAMVQEAAKALLPVSLRAEAAKDAQISILQKGATDIISVAVQSQNPDLTIAYANAICEAYGQVTQKNNSSQYVDTANYVGQQLENVRAKLDDKRNEVRKFKEKNHIVDLAAESTARVERLNGLEDALQDTEAGRVSDEARINNLRGQVAKASPDGFIPMAKVIRPAVTQLQDQLTSLETHRIATLQEYTPSSPEAKVVNDQIASVRRRLQNEATTEYSSYTRTQNPLRLTALQTISANQASLWAAQARAKALRQNIAQAQQEIRNLPLREYQLSRLQGDLETYVQTFQSLSDKYQNLLISQKTPVANARVITPAVHAYETGARATSTISLGVLVGLVLAIFIATIIDSLDNKIYTEEEAVQATGLPVLTQVPMITQEGGMQLLSTTGQSSVLLESFRMLRTQLSFMSSYGQLQSLVVTSSQPGEGKSIISANLAVALALNGKSVILVDADLRRPRVHTIFQLNNDKGFTNVVAKLCTIEDALQPTEVEGLRIMSSGPTPPNPPELLDSRPARAVVEQLKTMADFVIFDCPPALVLADAQITASMADGVVMVVSCQEARRNAIEKTHELLANTGIKIVGMVLNKFPIDQSGYYGYYGYGSSGYNSYLEIKSDLPASPLEKKIDAN